MSNEEYSRWTIIITSTTIALLGIASLAINIKYRIWDYFYFAYSVIIAAMIFGIIGALIRIKNLVIITSVVCWSLVISELFNIFVEMFIYYGLLIVSGIRLLLLIVCGCVPCCQSREIHTPDDKEIKATLEVKTEDLKQS